MVLPKRYPRGREQYRRCHETLGFAVPALDAVK